MILKKIAHGEGRDSQVKRFFPHPEALQDWSEQWCSLSVHAQKRQRYPFLMILGLSALVFSSFRFPAVMIGCLVLSCGTFVRIFCVFGEGSLGWLWGFGESLVENVLLNFVVVSTAGNAYNDAAATRWLEDLAKALVVIGLLVLDIGGWGWWVRGFDYLKLCKIVQDIKHDHIWSHLASRIEWQGVLNTQVERASMSGRCHRWQ